MNAGPHRGAFAAFRKQNDKFPTDAEGGDRHTWNLLNHNSCAMTATNLPKSVLHVHSLLCVLASFSSSFIVNLPCSFPLFLPSQNSVVSNSQCTCYTFRYWRYENQNGNGKLPYSQSSGD